MLTGVTSFGCALHRLILKSFVATAHRVGDGGDFDFLVAGPWHDPVQTAHLPGCGVITNDWWAWFISPLCTSHLWPLPPAQGNVEDFDFVYAVPHSNHHTVGPASWQNHDSSPPQSVIILHCHGCLCQCKSKITAHLPGYPRPAQGLRWSIGYKWLVHNL